MSEEYIKIYFCGLTPHKKPHIGHLRGPIIACFIARTNVELGKKVEIFSNFTDISMTMEETARKKGLSIEELSAINNEEYLLALCEHVYTPIRHVKVSEVVDEAIGSITSLIDKKLAEITSEGIKSSEGFMLWNFCDPGYPSPWGKGRIGWHISCNTIINHLLPGHTLDYHGGGSDLEIHHENEGRLQKQLFEREITRKWVRHGMVVDEKEEKISKSGENYVTLKETIRGIPRKLLRLTMLYRSPISIFNFKDSIQEARRILARLESEREECVSSEENPGETYNKILKCLVELQPREAVQICLKGSKRDPMDQRKASIELIFRTIL